MVHLKINMLTMDELYFATPTCLDLTVIPQVLEALIIQHLHWLWRISSSTCVIYLDNAQMVSPLLQRDFDATLENILYENYLMSLDVSTTSSKIGRQANELAHRLARHNFKCKSSFI